MSGALQDQRFVTVCGSFELHIPWLTDRLGGLAVGNGHAHRTACVACTIKKEGSGRRDASKEVNEEVGTAMRLRPCTYSTVSRDSELEDFGSSNERGTNRFLPFGPRNTRSCASFVSSRYVFP